MHTLQLRHPDGSGKAASVVEEDVFTGVCFAPLCTPLPFDWTVHTPLLNTAFMTSPSTMSEWR
jgi:hypothetical protein